MREILTNCMDSAVILDRSETDILKELTDEEIAFTEERTRQINLTVSPFPIHKTITDFDF